MELDVRVKEARALAALASAGEQGLTKNELAHAIWGTVTPSTQSMTTRVTHALLKARKVTEELAGRRRIVRLRSRSKLQGIALPDEALDALHEGQWSSVSVKLDEGWERPFDRPYAQLERAARWVAASLRPKNESDELFAKVLLRVLTYSGDPLADALEDRRAIEGIARGWSDDDRRNLARCIAVFGVSRERDFIAPELLRCSNAWTKGNRPESLLWAAMALAVARRLHLIGGERADADVERLRGAAVATLSKLKSSAPIHVAYWSEFSKALRGDISSLTWEKLETSRAAASVPSRTGKKLAKAIREDEKAVRRDAGFNAFFFDVERLISVSFTSEIERRIGFARRFRHDIGATPTSAESWTLDHTKVIEQVFFWFRREHRDDALVSKLASRISKLEREAPEAARVTRDPTLDLVRCLSAPEKKLDGIREEIVNRRANAPLEYTELIRNNFWTPSMLWSDIALSTRS